MWLSLKLRSSEGSSIIWTVWLSYCLRPAIYYNDLLYWDVGTLYKVSNHEIFWNTQLRPHPVVKLTSGYFVNLKKTRKARIQSERCLLIQLVFFNERVDRLITFECLIIEMDGLFVRKETHWLILKSHVKSGRSRENGRCFTK